MKKYFLLTILFVATLELFSQTSTNTRQIRFFAIATASDSAATVANNGRVWFDFTSQKLRGIKNATAYTIGEGSGGGAGSPVTINTQTASYQLLYPEDGENVLVRMNVVGANNLTVPLNATEAFPIGTIITIESIGDQTTVVATGGVTINASAGNMLSPADFSPMVLVKVGTNEWDLWNGVPATPNVVTGSFTATRVPFASGTNTLTDDADLTFSTDRLTSTNLTVTSDIRGSYLTSTRVPFITTSGAITDDADMTFTTASNTLTVGRLVGVPTATIPGINVGSFAGNPSTPVVGDMWYNSSVGGMFVNTVSGSRYMITGATSNPLTGQVPYMVSNAGAASGDTGFTFTATGDVLTVGSLTALTTATLPAINLGTLAGDPSTLTNGSLWYSSSASAVRARVGGATVSLAANNAGSNEIPKSDGNNLVATGLGAPSAGNLDLGLSGTAGTNRAITAVGSGSDIDITLTPKGSNGKVVVAGDFELNADPLVVTLNTGYLQLNASISGNVSTLNTALTSTTVPAFRLQHTTTDTPAAGIGVSLTFETETSAGNVEQGGYIESVSTDVTGSSEDFDLVFKNMAGGTAAAEKLRLTSDGRLYGTALHNNAGSVTGTVNQYVGSGTYTPTLFNTTNVAASTAYTAQWMRVGNVVTVSGKVDIDPTATVATELGMSLPIASGITVEEDLGGTAASQIATTVPVRARGDATNDRVSFVFTAVSISNDSYSFTFTYLIK